ncbi:hypothetical protein D1Z90_13640 [Motilimonas pumila]|uniref:Uncharacterized protein n=1 Tax=Motilimonas pumila TaxID=2303987 RepID=A0A418YCT8_9GAMM|nr:hypothetical protein D1Z90_13640 [Motilimonas pumila]
MKYKAIGVPYFMLWTNLNVKKGGKAPNARMALLRMGHSAMVGVITMKSNVHDRSSARLKSHVPVLIQKRDHG